MSFPDTINKDILSESSCVHRMRVAEACVVGSGSEAKAVLVCRLNVLISLAFE